MQQAPRAWVFQGRSPAGCCQDWVNRQQARACFKRVPGLGWRVRRCRREASREERCRPEPGRRARDGVVTSDGVLYAARCYPLLPIVVRCCPLCVGVAGPVVPGHGRPGHPEHAALRVSSYGAAVLRVRGERDTRTVRPFAAMGRRGEAPDSRADRAGCSVPWPG